jgi:hypothetical protein
MSSVWKEIGGISAPICTSFIPNVVVDLFMLRCVLCVCVCVCVVVCLSLTCKVGGPAFHFPENIICFLLLLCFLFVFPIQFNSQFNSIQFNSQFNSIQFNSIQYFSHSSFFAFKIKITSFSIIHIIRTPTFLLLFIESRVISENTNNNANKI